MSILLWEWSQKWAFNYKVKEAKDYKYVVFTEYIDWQGNYWLDAKSWGLPHREPIKLLRVKTK